MNTQTPTNITNVLNFPLMTELEQTALIEQIGDMVLEAAILRLVAELTPAQTEALDQFLETEPKAEVLLSHLITHHENFSQLLEEEAEQFRQDAIEVFGKEAEKTD